VIRDTARGQNVHQPLVEALKETAPDELGKIRQETAPMLYYCSVLQFNEVELARAVESFDLYVLTLRAIFRAGPEVRNLVAHNDCLVNDLFRRRVGDALDERIRPRSPMTMRASGYAAIARPRHSKKCCRKRLIVPNPAPNWASSAGHPTSTSFFRAWRR
jgi:hypothetical protein